MWAEKKKFINNRSTAIHKKKFLHQKGHCSDIPEEEDR